MSDKYMIYSRDMDTYYLADGNGYWGARDEGYVYTDRRKAEHDYAIVLKTYHNVPKGVIILATIDELEQMRTLDAL